MLQTVLAGGIPAVPCGPCSICNPTTQRLASFRLSPSFSPGQINSLHPNTNHKTKTITKCSAILLAAFFFEIAISRWLCALHLISPSPSPGGSPFIPNLVRMPLDSSPCRGSQPLQPLPVPRLLRSDAIKHHPWACETDSRRHAKKLGLDLNTCLDRASPEMLPFSGITARQRNQTVRIVEPSPDSLVTRRDHSLRLNRRLCYRVSSLERRHPALPTRSAHPLALAMVRFCGRRRTMEVIFK